MKCNLNFIFYHIWLFRKRHVFITLVQILAPALIIALLTSNSSYLYTATTVDQSSQIQTEQDLYAGILNPDCKGRTQIITYHTPSSSAQKQDLAKTIIENLKTIFKNNGKNVQFIQVKDQDEMIKVAVIHHALLINQCYIGGIVFLNIPDPTGKLLKERDISLSAKTKTKFNGKKYQNGIRRRSNVKKYNIFKVKILMASFIPSEVKSTLTHTLYFDPKFPRDYAPYLGIQMALSRAFVNVLGKSSNESNSKQTSLPQSQTQESDDELKIGLQSFPFPQTRYSTKSFRVDAQPLYTIVTITIVLGQTFMVFSLIRGPAFDKQTGFRTYLKLMGLPRATYWAMWFLNEFIVRIIVITIEIAMLFSNLSYDRVSLIQRGDYRVWATFLLIYNLASISFLIFIASFCKRGLFGIYMSATIWLLSYHFGDLFLSTHYFYLNYRFAMYLMCLNPNSALILASRVMTTQLGGTQWETIMIRPEKKIDLSLLEVVIMLTVDIFMYFMLTLYGDAITPGSYSVKFWQFFGPVWRLRCKDFWNRRKIFCNRLLESEASNSMFSTPIDQKDIVFTNVTMIYGNKFTVLKECNFKAQEKTSTAVIAPQGSGKTTMARLMCGAFPPTSGQVTIAGYDSITSRSQTKKMLSLCPEQNLFCHYFTLLEHLKLIGRLRGQRKARIRRKVREIFAGLQLNDFAHAFPDDLVYAQRRKMCIAMSLIGKSDIIMIDRPAKDLDRVQTQLVAHFIKNYCKDKTLVFWTQSLEHAYTFADNIAILANGRVLGGGTKEQVESSLKIGYHLILAFHANVNTDSINTTLSTLRNLMPALELLDKKSVRIQKTLEIVEAMVNEYNSMPNSPHRRSISKGGKNYSRKETTSSEHDRGTGTGSSRTRRNTNVSEWLANAGNTGVMTRTNSSVSCSAGIANNYYFAANSIKNSYESVLEEGGEVGDTRETEYLNFDELLRDPSKSSEQWVTLYMPKSELATFHNFFQLLELETKKVPQNILGFTLVPYTMQLAYEEVEDYMSLVEAKESFEITNVTDADEINEVNSRMLSHHLVDRLNNKGFQRFKSQIFKRISFMLGAWSRTTFQFFLPLALIALAVGANQVAFNTTLLLPNVDHSLSYFVNPVAMIKSYLSSNSIFLSLYKDELGNAKMRELDTHETFDSVINSFGGTEIIEQKLAASYVVGLKIDSTTATAMFSPIAFHAAPSSLSLLLNAYLRTKHPQFSMEISSEAIQPSRNEILNFYLTDIIKDFDSDPAESLAVVVSLGFLLFTSAFVDQPINENAVMLKRLQLNAGLSTFSYWLSFFIIDFLFTAAFSVAIVVILVFLPYHQALKNLEFITFCYLYLLLAGMSCIVQSYAFSFIFMQPKTSFYAMFSYNQVAGLFLYILNSFFTGVEGTTLKYFCRLFQPFNLPSGLFNLFTIAIRRSSCKIINDVVKDALCKKWDSEYNLGKLEKLVDKRCCVPLEYWRPYPGDDPNAYLGINYQNKDKYFDDFSVDLIFLAGHVIFGWIYIGGMEMGLYKNCCPKYLQGNSDFEQDDRDKKVSIRRSKNVIIDLDISDKAQVNEKRFTVQNVTKKYFMESQKILNDISFVASPGDLIGIIGPSKSGKTVLMEILARLKTPTKGSVFFGNEGDKETRDFNYLESVGYKPPSKILHENPRVKGITFLKLFARLRGIPEAQIKKHLEMWSKLLGLEKHNQFQCEYYTEGVISRYSLALALIGNPPLLLLDEPLNHLDPFSKKQFWTITEYLRKHCGCIVIMATSTIADLQFHCTKLGILVNGEMQCFMSPSTLKSKFGGGFILRLICQEGATFQDWNTIKERVVIDFPNCVLHDEQANLLEYRIQPEKPSSSEEHVPRSISLMYATIFSLAQQIAVDFPLIISEYYVSEESLRHIYDSFACKQRPYNKPMQTREEFCMKYC